MDIMQPRKIDGEGTYFNSCHLTSEILNNRQATFDNKQPKPHPRLQLLYCTDCTYSRKEAGNSSDDDDLSFNFVPLGLETSNPSFF